MEIAIVTAHLSERSGGLAYSVPGMLEALCSVGVDAAVIGLRDPENPEAWRRWGERVLAVDQVGFMASGWSPHFFKSIARVNPQVVDVQGLWMYPSIASLMWYLKSRRPYVITPRGMLDEWAVARAPLKKRAALALFERKHLNNAACLRATSELEAEHLRSFGLTNPIAVIPNGVELPDPRPSESVAQRADVRRRLLFLSRLHPKKGLDALIRVWPRLAANHPDWELVIAGPEELGHRQEMQALACSLRAERVIWRDPVYGREKEALYQSADLFVLPTHSENFGLVIAEALANETPVVTTRGAPWPMIEARGCGWYIDLGDEALATALTDAMGRVPEELREMGRRGRAFISTEFGWASIGPKLADIYAWVAGSGPEPDWLFKDGPS